METVKIYKLFLPSQKSMILTVSGTLFLILTAGFAGIYYDGKQISDPGEVIKITGNYDLLQQTAFNSWPGEGTESNPIIIENLRIYGITISETNLYFIFRNNKITGVNIFDSEWKGGVILNNVINGVLIENEIIHYKKNVNHISEFISGIVLIDSRSIIARNNQVKYYPQGIKISESKNIIFSDNKISNGITGVTLSKSDNILFKDGLIENNLLNGIKVESGFGNVFGGNTFKDNGEYSIILSHGSERNVITRNNMIGENLEENSQASDSGYANEFLSNYWSDFDNSDLNHDGFADYAYWISGTSDNKDHFPSATRIKLPFDFYNNLGALP